MYREQALRLADAWRGGLIVSCQALPGEPFFGSWFMAVMAHAAERGGAVGIRANGVHDVAAIRQVTRLPVIGLAKVTYPGSPVYITPTYAEAQALAEAGADVIALDATMRPRPGGEELLELIQRIHGELGLPVLADVSTVAEGVEAVRAGADMCSTTLAGYTEESHGRPLPDLDLVEQLARRVHVPVLAEGGISSPEQALAALRRGAHAVVVGTAITRPQEITRRYVEALRRGGEDPGQQTHPAEGHL